MQEIVLIKEDDFIMENEVVEDLLICIKNSGQSEFDFPTRNYIENRFNSLGELSRDKFGSFICNVNYNIA